MRLLFIKLSGSANNGKLQKADSIDNTSGEKYDIYVLMNPSKRELKWWNDVHSALHKSLSMIIPVEGHAKVRDNNCCLTQSQLQNLFFGKSYDPMTIDNNSTSTEEEKAALKKKLYHIAEQVLASSQKVVFPNPLTKNDMDTNHTKKSKKEEKLSEISSTASQSATMGSVTDEKPLILDVSIGMRLFNAYRNIHKDKKLRLWSNSRVTATAPSSGLISTKNSNTGLSSASNNDSKVKVDDDMKKEAKSAGSSGAAVVPGSAEWNKRKLRQKESGGYFCC